MKTAGNLKPLFNKTASIFKSKIQVPELHAQAQLVNNNTIVNLSLIEHL